MDTSIYTFNGETYGKGRLALAIITAYCTAEPRTLKEVNEVFGKVMSDEKTAKALADTSGQKRHFMDSPIKLKTGNGLVTNQIRLADIERLIEVAKEQGDHKEESQVSTLVLMFKWAPNWGPFLFCSSSQAK